MRLMYPTGKTLGRFCFGVLGRLDVTGRESVPPFGPVILIANHLSNNDPPVLVSALSTSCSATPSAGSFFGNLGYTLSIARDGPSI